MPIKNPKTGQYYPGNIEFISHDTINYNTSVQERMHLNKRQIDDLLAILTLQGSDDGLRAACFQPRNAVVVFKNNKMSCFDFCFDCYGFSTYGTFSSDLIMNPEKYHKLMGFYKKLKFKYELE
ncbi:MAG: hypothetical protein NTW29_08990 [Bacteroidetes bacterium]|nr:hypothetical protein [Bacteroidota bacterium]